MAIQQKSPEVRFDGFTEDWETDSFKNLTIINQGLQISIENRYKKKVSNSHFYITNEFLKEGAKSEYYILNPPESVLCTEDDVLMTRTGNTGEVVTGVNGAFHNNFFKIEFDRNKIDKGYLVAFLKNETTQSLISRLAGVSTIPDLNHNDFYQIEMPFPKIEEQNKISSLISNLDSSLKNHQTQLTKLKNLKKAMLVNMFPQEGATVPEIRFKGFEGEWEVKQIETIANRYDNLRVPVKASDRIIGKTPYYGANGIQDYVDGYTHKGEFVLIAEDGANDLKNYPIKYVKGEIWVNNHAHVIQAIYNVADNFFLSYTLKTVNIEPFLVGGGRAKLNAEIMMGIEISLPSDMDEQKKIGSYFKNLDELIENHQKQLEKLGNMKNACLNKMFVA